MNVAFVVRMDRCVSLRRAVTPDIFILFVVFIVFNGDFWGSDSLQFKEEMMMLRTSLSSSSSVIPSAPLPRRRTSKSRSVFVNSTSSGGDRYEKSFPSSSASGVRGVAANSFPRDDDDDVEEVVHTVAPGDSLYGVAIAYDVDPRDLIVSNRSSRYRSSSSSKRKSCISFVFEFLIQKYATSSIENKM